MKPVVLIILDGWGLSPIKEGNAVFEAQTPFFDYLQEHFPYFILDASGLSVGLAWGEMGNSEVGHMTIGSGQIVYQPLAKINMAIEDESIFRSKAILDAFAHAKKFKSKIHFMGLYSPGGIHSHLEHLMALLKMAKHARVKEVFLHLFTDGRDTPPFIAKELFAMLGEFRKELNIGMPASLMGRFYAMDRNQNWDRTEKAYSCLVGRESNYCSSFEEAIEQAYKAGVSDEFIEPVAIINHKGNSFGQISSNDAVIFFNFREDRARQLTRAFTDPGFKEFTREKLSNLFFVSFTDYGKDIPVSAVAFYSQRIQKTLGELIAEQKMKQLRIAETEKAAHVTYFFNGSQPESFNGEDRVLISSPSVNNFDAVPEMSAGEITEKTIKAIKEKKYSFIVLNFANPDMVGHTGNFEATKKAVSFIDQQLKKIARAVLEQDGVVLITGDHGNAEELINPITGKPSKEHSVNPVPFIVVKKDLEQNKTEDEKQALKVQFQPTGILADVTATALKFLGIKKPAKFIGKSLV